MFLIECNFAAQKIHKQYTQNFGKKNFKKIAKVTFKFIKILQYWAE